MKGSTLKKIQPNRKDRKRLRHKWAKETEEKKRMIAEAFQQKKQASEKKNEM